jgi:hypothetical protein
MTTEQRQFFAACVAAALFLGGADIGGHAGSADPVQPLTDRPALAPVRLQLAPVRSAPELIASLARAANMDRPDTPKEITGIIAGAITSLVILGWMVFLAIGYMSAR